MKRQGKKRGKGPLRQGIWITELLRHIKKTWVTFMSLAVIICVSVAVVLGTGFSGQAMRQTAAGYFDRYNLHDFEIVYPYGITQEDLAAILALDSVADAEGVYTATATAPVGNETLLLLVNSLSQRIDCSELVAGEWPSGPEEALIEAAMARETGLAIGDRLILDGRDSQGKTYLAETGYIISGLVKSPAYINNYSADSRGISTIGNSAPAYYIQVLPAAFDAQAFDNCYPKVLVTSSALAGLDRFSGAYWSAAYGVEKQLYQLGQERGKMRYDSLVGAGEAQLAQARQELAEGAEEIAEKEGQLQDAQWQIAAGEGRIQSGEDQLDSAERELYASESQIRQGESQLKQGTQQLAQSRAELDGYQQQLREAERQITVADEELLQASQQLEDANVQIQVAEGRVESSEEQLETYRYYLDLAESAMTSALTAAGYPGDPEAALDRIRADSEEAGADLDQLTALEDLVDAYYGAQEDLEEKEEQLAEAKEALADAKALYSQYLEEYQASVRTLNNAKGQLQEAKIKVNDGELEYRLGQEKVADYQQQLAEAKAQVAQGWGQYYDGQNQLAQGQAELEANQALLAEGREQLAAGKAALADGQSQADAAQNRLAAVEDYPWLLSNLKGNAGYRTISNSSANVSGLRVSFALVFIMVAVMVCFTSIGRMVSEQRELLGAQKALGFTRREIRRRFSAYTLAGAGLGCLLGWLAAFLVVEAISLNGYASLYIFDHYRLYFHFGQALLAMACTLAATLALTCLACRRQLAEAATDLLRGQKPPLARARFFEKYAWWGKQPLYTRAMVKSLLHDKRRLYMTIIGLAGCTALLVISLTMRLAISGVVERQYQDIYCYDLCLTTDSRDGEGVTAAFAQRLAEEEGLDYLRLQDKLYYFRGPGGDWASAHLISGRDLTYFNEFMRLRDSVTKESLAVPFSGALISQRIAEVEGWETGDAIQLLDGNGDTFVVTIAGIFENYAFHSLVMSGDYFEAASGQALDDNTFYINTAAPGDSQGLIQELSAMPGFLRCDDGSRNRVLFDEVSQGIDVLVAVLLVLSAAMAAMVLLDLNFMYIKQKSRELAVMRVNGYTIQETRAYVYRDSILLGLMGLILGVALGIVLGRWGVMGIEEDYIRFIREPIWAACLVAAAIGALFMVVVNLIALRQVNKLKLHSVSANQ